LLLLYLHQILLGFLLWDLLVYLLVEVEEEIITQYLQQQDLVVELVEVVVELPVLHLMELRLPKMLLDSLAVEVVVEITPVIHLYHMVAKGLMVL
tara:strand:- start:178 stop:462 length:285 start_codon:yes stop_codon:yes gene_type:complete